LLTESRDSALLLGFATGNVESVAIPGARSLFGHAYRQEEQVNPAQTPANH